MKKSKADLSPLKKAGLKRTDFRSELLKALRKARRPLTAAQIHGSLPDHFDRATLFRNLKTLVESKIVNASEFGTGTTYYCLEAEHHHHHVFCVHCEKTRMLDFCGVEPMVALAEKMGFQVLSHKMELIGICPACRS